MGFGFSSAEKQNGNILFPSAEKNQVFPNLTDISTGNIFSILAFLFCSRL